MSIANKLQTVASNLATENEKIAEQASLLAQINEALDGKTGTMGGGDYSDGYAAGEQSVLAIVNYELEPRGLEGAETVDDISTCLDEAFIQVADQGYQSCYDTFWDGIQDYGNRTDYSYAFTGWQSEEIMPKYIIRARDLYYLFANCKAVKRITKGITPLNGTFDMSYCAFHQCFALEEIGFDIPIKTTNLNGMNNIFNECHNLKTIGKITFDGTAYAFSNTFKNCYALENITFGGTIASSISFAQSSKLSADSIQSIIDALADLRGQTQQTITFHKDLESRVTPDQKQAIFAKNWNQVY